jgi:hypothetical protein
MQTTTLINVRITDELKAKLNQRVTTKKTNISNYLRDLINQDLNLKGDVNTKNTTFDEVFGILNEKESKEFENNIQKNRNSKPLDFYKKLNK